MINKIVKGIDQYFQDRNRLIKLKEIQPSEERMNAYWKKEGKVQAEKMKESQKTSSPIFEMAKTVNLKSGGTWFSKIDGQYSRKSSLGTFQYSGELPRKQLIDPIGQMRHQVYYRSLRKSNEVNS